MSRRMAKPISDSVMRPAPSRTPGQQVFTSRSTMRTRTTQVTKLSTLIA